MITNVKLQWPASLQVVMNRARKVPAALALGGLGLLASAPAVSAAYLTTEAIPGWAVDWTAAIWYTNTTPGMATGQYGTAVGATTGNNYEVLPNGTKMQSYLASTVVPYVSSPCIAFNPATFPGASLTVNTNTMLVFENYGPTMFTNLILKGGVLVPWGMNVVVTLNGALTVASQSYFSDASDGNACGPGISGGAYTIASAISGPGNIYFMNCNNGWVNHVTGGSANANFTGQWIIQNGYLCADNAGSLGTNSITVDPLNTGYLADMPNISPAVGGAGSAKFEVTYDLSSAGTLTIANGGAMVLHQHCAFSVVNINGTALSGGKHTYSQLTNSFPGVFSGGSDLTGDITVQPYSPAWPPLLPSIVTQPQPVSSPTGQAISFTVSAINGTLSYQWYATNNHVVTALTDSAGHSGSTVATLTFPSVAMSDAGQYFVVVSNFTGSVTSSVVKLSVFDPSAVPIISNVYPNGTNIYQPASALTFTVSSANASLTPGGIHLTLNGLDQSNHMAYSGNAQSQAVSCVLRPNQYYVAVISVTDNNGLQAGQTIRFDTFNANSVIAIEAEDYDYNGGQFVPNAGIDAYAGLAGVAEVDYHITTADGSAAAYTYRGANQMACAPAGDLPRLAYGANPDYGIGWFHVGEWANYTRNVPAGTYNVYARLASGNSGAQVSFGQVTSGVGSTSQGVQSLSHFWFNGRGWSSYDFYPLTDSSGNLITLNLNGATTFRLSSDWEANVNFIILVPVTDDKPTISGLYPDGKTLFQPTNKLVFTVSDSFFAISRTNVNLSLNGVDVSSRLSISGSANAWNVSVPIALGTNYDAVIAVTDSYGTSVTNSFSFDTFAPTNFTFEAEDFDFNGGSFIDNPSIGAYANQVSTPYIDEWYVTVVAGSTYSYRPDDWISTGVSTDAARQSYLSAGATDYQVGYWPTGSWINYTHTYPAGTYYVWARLAGNANLAYHVQLTNTVGGAATSLGQFTATGRGWSAYDWTPLRNASGQVVPVTLGGVSTLTVTTDGNVNANCYMLAPTNSLVPPPSAPNPVAMNVAMPSGALGGTNLVISFQTQAGYNYQVCYKTNLSDPAWLPLSTVAGNGAAQSVTNSMKEKSRFFRLQIQ